MSAPQDFRVASRFGLATTLLLFGLIVVGSVVRTTGSGLACPDWPLCEGRLIPRLEPHVLIEWFHRLLALLASLMVFATSGWIAARPELRARLGGLAALTVGLLLAQVLLGALTVWRLLSPAVVSSHLAVALLLFTTLLTITLVARSAIEEEAASAVRPPGLLPLFAAATGLAYVQCLLGGLVSSNGAGLACPDWPTCNGSWFPALTGPVGLQMTHRYVAYLLAATVLVAAVRARTAPDAAPRGAPGIRAIAARAALLVLLQVALGVGAVLLRTPPWISALHLANAAALLALLVVVTYRAATLFAAPVRAAGAAGSPAAA